MQFWLHALRDDTPTTHLGLSGNQNSVSVQDTINHVNRYGPGCSLQYLNMVQNVQQKYKICKQVANLAMDKCINQRLR